MIVSHLSEQSYPQVVARGVLCGDLMSRLQFQKENMLLSHAHYEERKFHRYHHIQRCTNWIGILYRRQDDWNYYFVIQW